MLSEQFLLGLLLGLSLGLAIEIGLEMLAWHHVNR